MFRGRLRGECKKMEYVVVGAAALAQTYLKSVYASALILFVFFVFVFFFVVLVVLFFFVMLF
jgi:hypothetical protein